MIFLSLFVSLLHLQVVSCSMRCARSHPIMVQNVTLADDKLRALNDDINKLVREKRAWERQIKSLGGPDYTRQSARLAAADDEGTLGAGGYRYYGAAKRLPGVRELLEKRAEEKQEKLSDRRWRADDGRLMRDVYAACDADYYGIYCFFVL